MNAFAQALLSICEEEGTSRTVEALRNKALERIASGEVKALVSSTVNSKAFNFQVSKSADVLFAEASWAIRQYNGGVPIASEIDFSGI